MFNRLTCFFTTHLWQNDSGLAVRGWMELPNPSSYCGRCGLTGEEYLR
jgi:hypothetical protein